MEHAQYQDAAEALQSLANLHCDPRASLLLAAAFEGGGDTPKAEEALQQAHSVWPSSDSIATSLAREYLGSGQVEKAAQVLEHFQATATTPSQEIEMGITVFLASHQLASAEALAKADYKFHPSLPSLLLLANVLQLEGRYKDVLPLLGSKRDAYTGSAAFLVTLAESEYDDAIYDDGRKDVERALSLDQTLYAAHYLLGNILLKQGDAEQAAAEYRIALQLSPNQPRTYYYLALALRAEHNEAAEEDVLAKAIALDSRYALAHCEMGRILLNQNRVPDAVAQLSLAVEDNASSEQAYYLLSRAYYTLGDKPKAEAMAKRLAAVRRANHGGEPKQSEGQYQGSHATNP